jgi:hypothetical protein
MNTDRDKVRASEAWPLVVGPSATVAIWSSRASRRKGRIARVLFIACIVLGNAGVPTRPWHAAPSYTGQKVAQQDRDNRSKEAVGLDIRSGYTGAPTTGAEIVGNGSGTAADVSVSAGGASSVTGVHVEQTGPGTGLRVIQKGPVHALAST